MSSFTKFDSVAVIQYCKEASDLLKSEYYLLTAPFVYHIGEYPSNRTVKVPAGYLTDGATIPRTLRFWASPIGRHAQAAILHDYLCEYLTIKVDGVPTRITRKEADDIFKESLLVLDVPLTITNMMYFGVEAYRLITNTEYPSLNVEKKRLEEKLLNNLICSKCADDPVCWSAMRNWAL